MQSAVGDLEQGRALCAQGDWLAPNEALLAAGRSVALGAADLERLATSAYMLGRLEDYVELATRFFAAAREGNLEGLEELLAHDVVLRGDGGGKAPALAHAVHGRTRVARTLKASMSARTRFGITSRPRR